MEMIKHFEIYIEAQKATGTQFVIFGAILLLAAILIHFSQINPITQGLRNGFFVISILLMACGVGFTLNQNNLYTSKSDIYQTNKVEFKEQEIERMQAVNVSVPKIIFGLSISLIILILAIVVFIHPPFWKGVSFSVAIYLLGILILETLSYLSVKTYLESLLI